MILTSQGILVKMLITLELLGIFLSNFANQYMRGCGGGGQGVQTPPLKNHKNIGFLSNIGQDLL